MGMQDEQKQAGLRTRRVSKVPNYNVLSLVPGLFFQMHTAELQLNLTGKTGNSAEWRLEAQKREGEGDIGREWPS